MVSDTKYQKYGLCWSPTDTLIAYTENDNITGTFQNIYKLNINNKSRELLIEGYNLPWVTDWNDISNTVLFSAEYTEVFKLDLNTKNITQLTNMNGGNNGFAKISPNGEKIVFEIYRGQYSQIYTMDNDGSRQVNISNSQTDDIHPLWSPDGSLITYASDLHKIKIMSNTGGGKKTLIETEGIITGFDWY